MKLELKYKKSPTRQNPPNQKRIPPKNKNEKKKKKKKEQAKTNDALNLKQTMP